MAAQQHASPPVAELPRPPAAIAVAPPAQELVVRRLKPADLPAVEDHMLALDPGGRARRFHALLGDDAVRAYVGRIDFRRMILVGAFEADSGRLIGLAEAHLDAPEAPLRTEVSVSVLARHRGLGLGRLLAGVALDAAAARGARRAEFHYQADNRPMARLVRGLGDAAAAAPGFACLALPLGALRPH
jgi:GNAT superfamily N-acetyltransferase